MALHAEATRRRLAIPPLRRSVSLEHDHASAESERPYIVTACARRAIQRIADGISGASSSRAWTLTGPFGTGKSSFALFLTQLLASPSSSCARAARERLSGADPSLVASLRQGKATAKGLIPVIITGAREPLSSAFARGMATALEASAAHGARRLATEIRETSNDGRRDLVKTLERAVSTLTSDGSGTGGVLIIIDELGKLLEFAAAHPDRSDVYLLQRLAEHAARAAIPTLLVGVLHQDFSGYAQELSEAQRQEWEKVRGRFEDIVFEQSADDMLRLIAEAMTTAASQIPPDATHGRRMRKRLAEGAWDAKIVPSGLPRSQGIPLICACYPLHPTVAVLLGPIFKRFGQNERSAFSFLASGEPHALADFTSRVHPGELYTLVHLYQYLISVFRDSLLAGKDGKRWAEAFNVESQHADLSHVESKLLRAVALLGIVGRWNGVAPTLEVLQFALSPAVTAPQVKQGIASLLARSAIVYRRFNETYSLWEGSDIDVEARVADARSQIAADASTVQLLRAHFTPRPIVARRHSFESGTLRYFDVVFATPNILGDTITAFEARSAQGAGADGQIIILLPDCRSKPLDPADASIQPFSARLDTLLCVPGNARDVEFLARELAAIQSVRRVTIELQNDATARRELAAREEDVRQRLEEDVADILAPARADGARARWYRFGAEEILDTPRAINEGLSVICNELYPSCPVIKNEIINRRELSSSAAAAQGRLIRHMLTQGSEPELAIEGNPPERSIYLSVLRSLKLHREYEGQWGFATSDKSLREDAQPLYRAISEFFSSAEDSPSGLDKLFARLRRPPFGLRNGVVPVFVCAALLGNESDVAVYENGAFLPQLTEAVFEKLVKDPSRFAVRRWHVSGVRMEVFEHLAKMLGQSPAAGLIEPRDLLDIVKPLLRFVRSLNPFTIQTKTFAPATVAVRDAIANATEPDQLLFTDLPRACGVDPFGRSKKDRGRDVTLYLRALQSSLLELQRGYGTFLRSLTEELAASLDQTTDQAHPQSRLAKRAASLVKLALNPEIKVFTARLADGTADQSSWIEQIAAFLASKHPASWHDDDRGRFSVRLAQMSDAFKGLESLLLTRQNPLDADSDRESIRISVVGTKSPQVDEVVHLSLKEAEMVSDLETRVVTLFEPYARNGSRKLFLAALARVAHTIVNEPPAAAGNKRRRDE